MVGHELAVLERPRPPAARPTSPTCRTRRCSAATGLGRTGAIAPVDLAVHPGEVVGLAGLLGSGRTELARLLFGADRADSGTVAVDGRPARLRSPLAAIAARIAFCSEDRKGEGIVGDLTVRDNLVLALQARRGWARPHPAPHRRRAGRRSWIAALDIRPANPDVLIRNLSRRQPAEGAPGPLAA